MKCKGLKTSTRKIKFPVCLYLLMWPPNSLISILNFVDYEVLVCCSDKFIVYPAIRLRCHYYTSIQDAGHLKQRLSKEDSYLFQPVHCWLSRATAFNCTYLFIRQAFWARTATYIDFPQWKFAFSTFTYHELGSVFGGNLNIYTT